MIKIHLQSSEERGDVGKGLLKFGAGLKRVAINFSLLPGLAGISRLRYRERDPCLSIFLQPTELYFLARVSFMAFSSWLFNSIR